MNSQTQMASTPKAKSAQNGMKFGVVAAYLVMLVFNVLAVTGALGSLPTAQISDKYPTLFTPAGITFSIWSIIYLLLGAYVVFQLGFFQSEAVSAKSELYRKIGILFIASAALNTLWLVMWQFSLIATSMAFMIALLIVLIAINYMLSREKLSFTEKILVRLPFSIYFGWITVATIANVSVLLVSWGWNGFGIPAWIWTVVMLVVGAIIAGAVMVANKDIAYMLAVTWGYLGIIIKHVSAGGFGGAYPQVIIVAAACIVLLIMAGGYMIARNRMAAEG